MAKAAMTRAEDLSAARRWTAFAFLMVAEFFYGWSFNTVDVLRPQIREALGLTLTEAGSAYTAQSLGALCGAVVLAQLADRLGRRRLLLWVIAGFGLFGSLGAFVTSYPQLIGQRFVLGFFLGGIFPVLVATYMNLFPSSMRGKLSALGLGTYSASTVALGWAYGTEIGQADWRILLWAGALPALIIAPLVYMFLPDDRHMKPWGAATLAPAASKLPVMELFTPALRRSTLLLFMLVGLNFFGYQAFGGWVTTYLKETKNFTPEIISSIVTWQAIGGLLGCFFWGWFSDRYGRRLTGVGFFAAGGSVLLYLLVFDTPLSLQIGGGVWNFMIAASVAWAPWMSELYPPHLRSTAMSIFHWGRIISMTAPLVTGAVAEALGLPFAMTLSAVAFIAGGFIWLSIPETVARRRGPVTPAPA
jgi:predicted MFS family arabinose efflux permease